VRAGGLGIVGQATRSPPARSRSRRARRRCRSWPARGAQPATTTSARSTSCSAVRQNEGVAARILLDFDADAEKIRERDHPHARSGRRQGGFRRRRREVEELALLDRSAATAQQAGEGVDPAVGRQIEIERTSKILSRRQKNNPVLIGEPGAARRRSSRASPNQVPELLKGKQIYSSTGRARRRLQVR
jgi:ATP-dependent Clp protease ATP-binding subunit ClpA